MRWDFFHRCERAGGPLPVTHEDNPVYLLDLSVELTLAEALEQAYVQGLPRGSHRAGCFEVQNDLGIWKSPTGSRINPKTAIFLTWEQVDQLYSTRRFL